MFSLTSKKYSFNGKKFPLNGKKFSLNGKIFYLNGIFFPSTVKSFLQSKMYFAQINIGLVDFFFQIFKQCVYMEMQ